MEYLIHNTAVQPSLQGEWDGAVWRQAMTGHVDQWLPHSTEHHPATQFRALYDDAWFYLIFRVEDQYVRSVVTEFQGSVCGDSCTEFFVQPKEEAGYLNFEVNCGGTLLVSYIEDPTPAPGGFTKYRMLAADEGSLVRIYHSMPAVVEPEITEPTAWVNEVHIPFALFEQIVGPLGKLPGQVWRANFYKCGDKTSHPHWGTWAPIEGASFHQPQYFAPIRFAE
jgi:hypothetical protein